MALVLAILSVTGCDINTLWPDYPGDDIEGLWVVESINTRTYAADGTVLTDETTRDLGTIEFGYDVAVLGSSNQVLFRTDGAIASQPLIEAFRPIQLLRDFFAIRRFVIEGTDGEDNRTGAGPQWVALDERLVFHGLGSNNIGEEEFSYVLTTVFDGGALTLLYVEADHPLDQHYLSYRQEARLRRL
ncbi:MAG: hypothetical protein AAGJ10_13240 [Bacteroidota bacterium]